MSRTKLFGVGLLLAAGAALIFWSSCGASNQKSAATPSPETPGGPAVPAPAPSPTDSSPTAPTAGDSSATATASGTPSLPSDAGAPTERPGSSIAHAVAGSDPRDLALLSRIERELGRTPPPEVHALIERRKQGASRDELTRRLRELSDLQLRVLVIHWLDEVFGPPAAGAPPLGHGLGSASPLVKPVKPAP